MRPFLYERVDSPERAAQAASAGPGGPSHIQAPTQFVAGGTTLTDLMKIDVMRPDALIDINPAATSAAGRIEATDDGLRLGALVRMAQTQDHPAVKER